MIVLSLLLLLLAAAAAAAATTGSGGGIYIYRLWTLKSCAGGWDRGSVPVRLRRAAAAERRKMKGDNQRGARAGGV